MVKHFSKNRNHFLQLYLPLGKVEEKKRRVNHPNKQAFQKLTKAIQNVVL